MPLGESARFIHGAVYGHSQSGNSVTDASPQGVARWTSLRERDTSSRPAGRIEKLDPPPGVREERRTQTSLTSGAVKGNRVRGV